MLENLFQLIKEQGQEQVVENPDIPNEQNDAVLAEASHAVAGTMQNALANGQVEDVQKMFQSNSSAQIMANPVAQNMQGSFIDNITSKLGINKNVAMGLAATLIPIVISKLVKRTNSTAPQDNGFDLGSLIGGLTGGGGGMFGGGNSGGLGGMLGQLTGNSSNTSPMGNSGGGLMDMISQITNGAQQQQQQGGLGDLIKGFFGK
jgi:hypothetical protein